MTPANVRLQPPANPQSSSGTQGSIPQTGPTQGQPFGITAGLNPIDATGGVDNQDNSPKQQYLSQTGVGPPQLPNARPSTPLYSQSSTPTPTSYHNDLSATETPPPSRPVFGVSLDDLLRRDGSAIPLVVYQCLQAVDLFGLEVEGIYRLSGSAAHVAKLRAIFDNGKVQMTMNSFERT